ncbi:Sm-like ribonucleo protein [Hesseltinella vesiculosa]|uniref:LSM2-LSM8 complex subunit LSM8 n=1 Tax=Hesseltinella vesiculosa TaxID=101127 RepID=A0A1X2GS88_9FUNG|nr:Sm-like ribonucleo protein [Hesseltinella vesiculosa]
MSLIQPFINQKVLVVTMDGRVYVGTLLGTDHSSNMILDKCEERVFSTTGTEISPLGVYVIRGDNLVTIGILDPELDEQTDLATVQADPLPELRY